LVASLVVSVSQPSVPVAGSPSQSAVPAGHMTGASHWPALQTSFMPHALPHEPQLFASS